MAEDRKKVEFKDEVVMLREEFNQAHYKPEVDAAISKARRIRKSDERTNLMLALVGMGTNKLALAKGIPPSPLADAMSSMDVAKVLQTFRMDYDVDNNEEVVPFRDSRLENIERLVNRNIEQGLISKNIDDKGAYLFDDSVALEQPANYCISLLGLGYLTAQGYNCIFLMRRLVQNRLIEILYGEVPIKAASKAGYYETKWKMDEKVYDNLGVGTNEDMFVVDNDLLANADKIAKLAAAIAEKDWAYCYAEKENKDAFVSRSLMRFDLPEAILVRTINSINPEQKGGKAAARRVRDAIADIWKDEVGSMEAARTHVEEMMLRDSYLTLRSTLDKQTGLTERALEIKEEREAAEDPEEELIELGVKGPSDQEQAFIAERVHRLQVMWQNFQVVEEQSHELLDHYNLTHQMYQMGEEEYPNGLDLDYVALSFKNAEGYMDDRSRDPLGWEWSVREVVSEFNLALENLEAACQMLGMDFQQVAIVNPLPGIDEEHSLWIMNNKLQVIREIPVDYRVS